MILNKKSTVGGAFARKKSYEYEGKTYEADIKDGDIVTILSDGQVVSGEYGEQYVFKIKTRNGERNLSFNQTTINNMIDSFGTDTSNYIGKEAKVWIIKAMVSGKLQNVAYLSSKESTMDDDGVFKTTKIVEGKGYEGEINNGEVNPDDVPF